MASLKQITAGSNLQLWFPGRVSRKIRSTVSPITGGSPAKSFRMAFGALTLKERLNCSDGELVEQIRENPYLQYFLGLEKFSNKPPFLPCVTDSTEAESSPTKTTDNKGQLILDATYTPADISSQQTQNFSIRPVKRAKN